MWVINGLSPAGVCALTATHYCHNAQVVVTTMFPTIESATEYARRAVVANWQTIYALNVRTGEMVAIKAPAEKHVAELA